MGHNSKIYGRQNIVPCLPRYDKCKEWAMLPFLNDDNDDDDDLDRDHNSSFVFVF